MSTFMMDEMGKGITEYVGGMHGMKSDGWLGIV